MKTLNIKFKICGFIFMAFIVSCETTDLELIADPSELTPESADPNLLLNNVQLRFVQAIAYNEDNQDGLHVRAAETVRMQHLFGAYTSPFAASSGALNNAWTDLYREVLQDIKLLIPLAEERELDGTVAVAKFFKAFSYVTLVDIWGDVPYTEALQGSGNNAPNTDDGQIIYNAMLEVLDEAIAIFETNGAVMPNDLFYNGDAGKWAKAARTLQFKMYVQMRLVGDYASEINSLINKGIIEDSSDDFQFQFSSAISLTGESRHPSWVLNYNADGADDFMNNYYMHLLKDDKGFNDPRLRYYFYRQVEMAPAGDFLECEDDNKVNFCYIGDFYWGRDHGYDEGVDPDQFFRTTYGIYPVGGAFDDNAFIAVTGNPGLAGAGIFPFLLSGYVKFLEAESALMIGTTGDPRNLLEAAIRDSMDKVLNFGNVSSEYASTASDVDNYVDYVLDQYDASSNDEERLDVIMKEYYIALWGNGVEAYNMYRRTGYPSDMSSPVNEAGAFPRSFLYPANESATNPNLPDKLVSVKVFWDNNPDVFD